MFYPVTMERLHTAEERARQARIELQKTNRKDQEAFSLPKKQTPIKDAENFDRESRQPSEDGVHSSLLTQTQRNKDPPHVPNRTDLSHTVPLQELASLFFCRIYLIFEFAT